MVLKIEQQLANHEGKERKLYKCTAGKWSIGIGRNLEDNGLSDDEIDYLFQNDLKRVIKELDTSVAWWRTKRENVRNVLIDMCFNLGITRLLGFKRFLEAMKEDQYEKAIDEMKDSLWYKQVPNRVESLISILRNG